MKFAKIPMATINRLSIYLRNLDELMVNDVEVISSERLAKQCGVNPAQIRKDLAYFGEFGVRGVGYRVKDLYSQIQEILGLNRPWNMALFGVGNLGSALIRHANFLKHRYKFVAPVAGSLTTKEVRIGSAASVKSICRGWSARQSRQCPQRSWRPDRGVRP